MKEYLDELFAAPINLQAAYNMDGTTFYSSDKLKEKFVLAFEKSSKGSFVSKEVNALVKKNIIIPCYKSKNLLGFIKHKLTKGNKIILAFYAVDDKKVVVIIDNEATIFGTSSNNNLASTTMHECIHLVAGRNLPKFIQTFKPYLTKYYSSFFEDYLQVKNVGNKQIDEYINFMSILEKKGPIYANKKLSDLYKLLEKLFSQSTQLDEQLFAQKLTHLIVATKLFLVSMPSLMKNARKFSEVFTSLNRAYYEAFKEKNTYTFPIQEMVSLSEVACVLSEMKPKDNVIKKLFQIIA